MNNMVSDSWQFSFNSLTATAGCRKICCSPRRSKAPVNAERGAGQAQTCEAEETARRSDALIKSWEAAHKVSMYAYIYTYIYIYVYVFVVHSSYRSDLTHEP